MVGYISKASHRIDRVLSMATWHYPDLLAGVVQD